MSEATAANPFTSSPTPNLTKRLGELKNDADRHISNLTSTLREIDKTRTALRQHGIEMSVDLGDVGNAAMAAHRAVEEHKHESTFTLPRAS